jgi:hypothetical protein
MLTVLSISVRGSGLDELPDHLGRHAVAPHTWPALLMARNTRPRAISAAVTHVSTVSFTPGNRDRPQMAAFTEQVRDHPVLLAALQGLEGERE